MIKIKMIILIIFFGVFTSLIVIKPKKCVATWYNKHGAKTYSKRLMHRDSATAAYNGVPMFTKLLVKNIKNNKEIVVTVTDKMELNDLNRIDLSYKAFGVLEKHSVGKIEVTIKKY